MTAPELDVAAVQARLDAALALTPEPWEVGDGWVYTLPIYADDNRLANVFGAKYADPDRAEAERERGQRNAELFAHAPTDLRLLLEALKEARAEARRYRLANREHIDTIDELQSEVTEHQKRADLVASNESGMLVAIVNAETERDEQAARATAAEAALVAERAKVERVRGLVDEWLAATCLTDGAPCSFHRHATGYRDDVLAALDGTDAGDEQ